MTRIAALLIAFAIAAPAAAQAQDAGGLPLAPEWLKNGGPTGLAKPLPFVYPSFTAQDVQSASKATNRTAKHQELVGRVRGDAGYLGGFRLGTPNSASVQNPGGVDGFGADGIGFGGGGRRAPSKRVIVNNNTFEGPVAITSGQGNNVQIQSATGNGPIALQQVTTVGARNGGGNVNTVVPGGNIVQAAPAKADAAQPAKPAP